MPRASSIAQARADKRAGKAPTTQAGHFVHDEIEAVRRGKHGVRSAKQAIAIGLSEARRAGVDVPPKKDATRAGTKSAGTKSMPAKSAAMGGDDKATPRRASSESKATRARAALEALKREGTAGASRQALSAQSKRAASTRTAADRSASAKKAAITKGAAGRSEAARKAARTRATRKQAGR
ncbi:DUF6496 domain-containing protein [Cupriavidus sp. D39]|uniref:DUF6496 domain-containing protein n=1 Tax=Cupriavidus sp. D39 TaxID=2997877 RepID=UPI00226E69F1|nr:DUF6496 domain-containing protein [Cupriavidus sp. D39]MCY0853345.1 DUF6496 domain-containing protein [Cupriavidus sp. D39]